MQFAQASVALPRDEVGRRWRACVSPAIGLQAVTFALQELETLPEADRLVSLDRAAALIDRHENELTQAWAGAGELHPELAALIAAARQAWTAASLRTAPPRDPQP